VEAGDREEVSSASAREEIAQRWIEPAPFTEEERGDEGTSHGIWVPFE